MTKLTRATSKFWVAGGNSSTVGQELMLGPDEDDDGWLQVQMGCRGERGSVAAGAVARGGGGKACVGGLTGGGYIAAETESGGRGGEGRGGGDLTVITHETHLSRDRRAGGWAGRSSMQRRRVFSWVTGHTLGL